MVSDRAASGTFALGLALRALVFAILLTAAVVLAVQWKFYVTSALLGFLGCLALVALIRFAELADLHCAQAIDCIADGAGVPVNRLHPALNRAVERALTKLRQERIELHRRADHLQAVCDSVPAALLTIDRNDHWTVINRAGWNLTGSQDVVQFRERLGPEAVASLRSLVPGRQEIIRLPGSGRRLLANCSRWHGGSENEALVVLVPVDELLDRIESQAWEDLVRTLAHEMMNSLTPIISLAGSLPPLLRKSTDAGQHREAMPDIEMALEAIRRRAAGLADFVATCRSIGLTPTPQPREVTAQQLVDNVWRLVKPQLEGKGIRLVRHGDTTDLRMRVDSSLVEQALINLLRNAEDAVSGIEDACIELRVDRNEGFVSFTVADNGAGVSPEIARKVFAPFFTTKAGGTGIGLTFVRKIAVAHKGSAEIAANSPRGTAVSLLLPAEGEMRNR